MSEPIRVLCVDDNDDLCEVMRRFIDASPGMKSVGALNSADNVEAEVVRVEPHVILMDLTMHGRDPLLAIKSLVAAHPRLQIIAFSGRDDEDTRDAARKAGALDLISKHWEPRRIIAEVCRIASCRWSQ